MSLPDQNADKAQKSIAAEFKGADNAKNPSGSEVKPEQSITEAAKGPPQNEEADSHIPEAIKKDEPQINHPAPTPFGDKVDRQAFNDQLAKDRETARKNAGRIKSDQKLNDKERGLMVKKEDVRSGKRGVLKQDFSKEDDGLGM